MRMLSGWSRIHSKNPSATNRHRRFDFKSCENIVFLAMPSERALMGRAATSGYLPSFA